MEAGAAMVVLGTCLLLSVGMNIDNLIQWRWGGRRRLENKELSWTKRAAVEAEEAAAIACSGHGVAYMDGYTEEGKPVCECRACFVGHDCSLLNHDCSADVDSGDPLYLEPFWMGNKAAGTVVVAGWHRMSYSFNDDCCNSGELKKYIIHLHASVGNAVTTGRSILFGSGSTQLLNAAVHALSFLHNSTSPTRVLASIPFYPVYKAQTDFFKSTDYMFLGDTASFKNSSTVLNESCRYIEFVTSPNNPDGKFKKAVLKKGPSVNHIYDFAYYWPHYTAIEAPADEDIMIFTTSKLTGHAGSRLGWALVKDKAVYESMQNYIKINTLGVSKETQLRLTKLLEFICTDGGRQIFDFGYKNMRKRWKKLSTTISESTHFSLQTMKPMYCTYFKTVRDPSPAYAWIKCGDGGGDCGGVLKRGGIIGRNGKLFSSNDSYVRLSLLKSDDDFDLMLTKIKALVLLHEEEMKKMMSFL